MSINYQLPKSARFLQKSVEFIANFNFPTPGKFDFNAYELYTPVAVSVANDTINLNGDWPVNTAVKISLDPSGAVAPMTAPLVAGKTYYIVSSVPAQFGWVNVKLSETLGGPVINLTVVGGGIERITAVYPIVNLVRGSLYFLERINIGGTIPEDEYLGAIDSYPLMTLNRSIDGQKIFPQSLPIVNYIDNQECNAWIWTDKDNDTLEASITGQLFQSIDLVGIDAFRLAVQFNLYEINDNAFINQFKQDTTAGYAGTKTIPRPVPNVAYMR